MIRSIMASEIGLRSSDSGLMRSYLRGPARLSEFSTIIVAGASALTVSEKKTIRNALAESGIPLSLTESDDDLQDVAIEIAGRSVELR